MRRLAIPALIACIATAAQAQSTGTPPVWADQAALDCVHTDKLGSEKTVLFRVDLVRNSMCARNGATCEKTMPLTVERKSEILILRIAPEGTSPRVFEILPNGKYTFRKPGSSVVEGEGVCQKASA